MPEGPGGLEGFLGQKSPWGPPQLDIELIRLKHALAQVGAAGGKARRGTGRKRAIPASKDRQPSPHPKGDMVLHYDPKHNRERRRARRALRGKYF
jgi:hypothetical protein